MAGGDRLPAVAAPPAATAASVGDVLIDLGPEIHQQDPAIAAAAMAVAAVTDTGSSNSCSSDLPAAASPFLLTSVSADGSTAQSRAGAAAPGSSSSLGSTAPAPAAGPTSSTYVREGGSRSHHALLGQAESHKQQQTHSHSSSAAGHTASATSQQQQPPHNSSVGSNATVAEHLLHRDHHQQHHHQQHQEQQRHHQRPEQQQQQDSYTALANLRQYSSQHYWLHDQPRGDPSAAAELLTHTEHDGTEDASASEAPLKSLAVAAGAAMRGLFGSGTALSGVQSAQQIAYPSIRPAADRHDEAAAAFGVGSGMGGVGGRLASHSRRGSSGYGENPFDLGLASFVEEDSSADSGAHGIRERLLNNAFRQFSGTSRSSDSPAGSSGGGRQGSFKGFNFGGSSGGGRQASYTPVPSAEQQQYQLDQGSAEGLRQSSGFLRTQKRWQAAAESVMQMKRVASTFQPGSLQGLDVKRHNYDSWMGPLLHTTVNVTVTDYNNEQVKVTSDLSNDTLADFLQQPRPEWSKVRWINVQGLSWDVIQMLAVAYDLHPLSVEDIVHIPQRIKADYFQEYLYTSVLLVSVDHPSKLDPGVMETEAAAAAAEAVAAAGGATAATTTAAATAAAALRQQAMQQQHPGNGMSVQQRATLPTLHRLRTRLKRVGGHHAGTAFGATAALHPMELLVEQASLFLFRDGTLITLFSHEGEGAAHGILQKLKGFKTLLTDSEDASFLFNAVLDAVVDHTMPVVQVYADRIAALEAQVLLDKRPPARLTKELHLLGNDLKVLRRTLIPTQHLIHKLQDAHAEREERQRFLSALTVVYMSDVLDHISTIVEDMETLFMDARDLIDLVFNTIAHYNNNSMQMLAVVSTIFLPITFIAGVYGTNFDQWFPEIHWQWGYIYFWGICAGVTVVFVAMLKRLGLFTA